MFFYCTYLNSYIYQSGEHLSIYITITIKLHVFSLSLQVGGKILYATDDWFAVAENLLKVYMYSCTTENVVYKSSLILCILNVLE